MAVEKVSLSLDVDLIAKARLWPERLGAGKPYPADVDERLEDVLAAWVQRGNAVDTSVSQRAYELLTAARDPLTQRVLKALLPGDSR